MFADNYSEKGAIKGFLGHFWTLYPSLIAPPPKSHIPYNAPLALAQVFCLAVLKKLINFTITPADGSANSMNIVFPTLTDGILDLDGTAGVLFLLFGENKGFK